MTPAPTSQALPRWANDIATSLMMGAGAIYVQRGLVTSSQESAIVGGVLAVASVAYGYLASHSSHQNPVALIRSLVAKAPAADQAAFDTGLTDAEAAIIARLTPIIHAQVRAHFGLLAGPVDGMADTVLRTAADAAVTAVSVPHLKI